MPDTVYVGSLTEEELFLLDGKTRPEIQGKIDRIKRARELEGGNVSPAEAKFIADVLSEIKANKRLVFRFTQLRVCEYTGKRAGYAKYTRNTRYHNKGDINRDKPLTMLGVELADRFVVLSGHATLGCCKEFWETVRPKLLPYLENAEAEIPQAITGYPPKWKRVCRKRCTKCQWEGHEGQMGKLPAIMGGSYPGKCPECGATNLFLGATIIETTKGFELIPTEKNQ